MNIIGYVKHKFTVFWEGKLVCPYDCSVISTNVFPGGKRHDKLFDFRKVFAILHFGEEFGITFESAPDFLQ